MINSLSYVSKSYSFILSMFNLQYDFIVPRDIRSVANAIYEYFNFSC